VKQVDFEAINSKHGCIRYWDDLTFMANKNRKNPTETESKIWNELLSRDKTGFRFVRQKPLHRFIADFYCSKLSLVIEIDGDSHNKKKEADMMRDEFLKRIGINTIRFTNEEILSNIESVKIKLNNFLTLLLSKRG